MDSAPHPTAHIKVMRGLVTFEMHVSDWTKALSPHPGVCITLMRGVRLWLTC